MSGHRKWSEVRRPRAELDEAWARAWAALPPEWDLSVGSNVRNGGGYFATATGAKDEEEVITGEYERHETPAAALQALVLQLRELRGDAPDWTDIDRLLKEIAARKSATPPSPESPA